MDKFLVDLDSVLDKLEAEDADRCATDELDDDEPCNLIGSSVYRTNENDKVNENSGGGGGISHLHHLSHYKYHQQESKIVQSSDIVIASKSNVTTVDGGGGFGDGDGTDGGSCSNDGSQGISEIDSFFTPSQSTSIGPSLDFEISFGNSDKLPKIERKSINAKTSGEKSIEDQLNNYLIDNFKDEPDTISSISGIRDCYGSNDGTKGQGAKGEDTFTGNDKPNEGKKVLIEPITSNRIDEKNSIQQSVNLEQTCNNTINYMKPLSSKDINCAKEYIGLEKNDSLSKYSSPNVTQTESKPIGEQVTSSDSFGDLLLSNNPSSLPSSSTITQTTKPLPKSNLFLDNPKSTDSQFGEVLEEESDEDMTEEEVKALEKELESELERLNNQSTVSTLEDMIESETKSATLLPSTETMVSSVALSPQESSVKSSPSSSDTSSSSPLSPSSPSTSTSSLSTTLSKPIDTSLAIGGASLSTNQLIIESQRSFSKINQNESTLIEPTTNDNESITMVKRDEEISSTSNDDENIDGTNSLVVLNKPVRPATLPLSNNNSQSNQPGHTPMHGDGDELIPNPSPTETETEQEISSSPTSNNQMERDIVPENVQASVSSIGYFKPFWIPDEDAPQCMICDAKFTVMKRRHHCRACGKVLCAQCSRFKAPLAYLSYDKARVCDQCLPLLTEGGNISGQDNSFNDSGYYQQQTQLGAEGLPPPSAPPSHQLTGSSPLIVGSTAQSSASSSSMIQPVSVLRRPSKPRTGEPKQVIFADGIRPGNDLKDDQVTSISHRRHAKKVKSPPVEKNPSSPGFSKSRLPKHIVISDANGQLPPIPYGGSFQHYEPTFDNLIVLLEKEDEPPITFSLTKNLMALVKLVKLDCCTNEICWSFTSQNLSTVGQDEIIVVVEKNAEENVLPRDIFRLFAYIYDSASKGYPFSELSHVLYPDGLFGLKDFPSFVFIRPTFQCLKKLTLPPAPFLIGVLIHRFEVPWAKLFPLRLIFRLGLKYHCYPCPIVSYRSRRPSFFEIGHTIMNILADFRNFQYTLPVIPGLTIHTEAKRTKVTLPKNRYDKVMKALGSSNESVLSFGGTFSLSADSHLTCIQNDDGHYDTRTIKLNENDTNEPKITGASYIVFSGALKSSTGMVAKMSIVEDGLLVQVTANMLNSLKSCLKNMKNLTIECGEIDAPNNEESVSIIWGEDDKQFNLGVRSCIDGLSLEGINSIRMYSGTDFEGDKYLIRWVELFLIQNTELPRSSDGYDAGRAAEIIAQTFCPTLVPCLESLVESKIRKIGLRVTLDSDKIGYDVGSNGLPLPSNYINRLDAALIPIIIGNIAPNLEVRLVIELIFYILVK